MKNLIAVSIGFSLLTALLCPAGASAAEVQAFVMASTPPMGWNSWNAFEKEIDEKKIRAIADAMVSSGMRDAGYTYLVLDDAWMAAERDSDGRLQADPVKFPSGMKAIGDYIHSKGLKYGIYEDRGKWTCQQLPGSFEHERIDMLTFADWGVDYIKMDSCFAESNGRKSSEDYLIYRQAIRETGRPILLSISDFGNAAWAWGGKESAQLWRTSGDIYPWMDSVYHCANTTAGDQSIHPAFNGLWQFAGPGHWNDPDMLHIGNLKHIEADRRIIGDRAHFSLWCILAAPLMAGNDLRSMSQGVRDVLTAPELIAVNQDKRGLQGYKVFSDEGREIYNKPLADGTTAVLILNKRRQKADIALTWDMIGLVGEQPVRDLWARKDLGRHSSFTARELGQHEHRMLKIGRPGPPLPSPDPMPLERYTVTRKGGTFLSDLYYIWKHHNAPVYDANFSGDPIKIRSKVYAKGLGCKGKSSFMFKIDGRADRFRARVALDASSEGKGRFKLYDEDFFGNKVLWDSKEMTHESAPQEVDVDLKGVECLMLVFEGKNATGNWADARVIQNGSYEPSSRYREQEMEGWKVRVHVDLLPGGEQEEMGAKAVTQLKSDLAKVKGCLSEKPLEKLLKVGIWLDLDSTDGPHGRTPVFHYHPGLDWLVEMDMHPGKHKCVEFSRASSLVQAGERGRSANILMHEFAHAYHDQVMTFEDPDVLAAHQRAREGDAYPENDWVVKADHKEFFAGVSTRYFGTKEERAALVERDSVLLDKLKKVWGEPKAFIPVE